MVLPINSGISQSQQNYISPDESEKIANFLDKDKAILWAKSEWSNLSDEQIKALVSNLAPMKEKGEHYLQSTLTAKGGERSTEILAAYYEASNSTMHPVGYDDLERLGYPGVAKVGSPYTSVRNEQQQVMFDNRGLYIHDGKLKINANVFAQYILKRINLILYSDNSVYVYDKKSYYRVISDSLLKKICREILHEAKAGIWNRSWESEYFEALKREMPYIELLNPNEDFINLSNGMLNIYTRELVEHSPNYLSSIQIPIEYNKEAKCPFFNAFVLDIFDNDLKRVELIQEIMGYCFLRDVKIQKSFIFYGSGSNGKSVLAEIIRHLVGVENTSNVPLNSLSGKFGMQNLPDKLVNISSENEFNKKFNTQNFKLLTGGDAVNVEQKYKDSYNTKIFAKIVILVNRMMDTDDFTNGFYRRLQIIPFNKIYVEKAADEIEDVGTSYMDKSLTEKLLSELDGIFLFAINGLQRLVENNFNLTYSPECEKSLENYKIRQNPLLEFFTDNIIAGKGLQTKRVDFKKSFDQWALRNGFDEATNISNPKFWDLLNKILADKQIHYTETKIRGDIYIKGLSVNAEKELNSSEDYISSY